jgi:hypothetical protein
MCGPNSNHSHGPQLPAGTLRVLLLPDGRIKIETGSFAGAIHASASEAIPALAKALGVTIEDSTRIVQSLVHNHVHTTIKNGNG